MSDETQAIATVPDVTTAELLEEVLHDGGIDRIHVRSVPGNAYLGHASPIDFEVRVGVEQLEQARRVLADFEAESGLAATRQAGIVDAPEVVTPPARKRWVLWVAAGAAFVIVAPILYSLFIILVSFVHQLRR